jgi:hypothetical protein
MGRIQIVGLNSNISNRLRAKGYTLTGLRAKLLFEGRSLRHPINGRPNYLNSTQLFEFGPSEASVFERGV